MTTREKESDSEITTLRAALAEATARAEREDEVLHAYKVDLAMQRNRAIDAERRATTAESECAALRQFAQAVIDAADAHQTEDLAGVVYQHAETNGLIQDVDEILYVSTPLPSGPSGTRPETT